MEREQQIGVTELKDEDLDAVNGGTAFRFIKAIFYPGKSETDSGLATNSRHGSSPPPEVSDQAAFSWRPGQPIDAINRLPWRASPPSPRSSFAPSRDRRPRIVRKAGRRFGRNIGRHLHDVPCASVALSHAGAAMPCCSFMMARAAFFQPA